MMQAKAILMAAILSLYLCVGYLLIIMKAIYSAYLRCKGLAFSPIK